MFRSQNDSSTAIQQPQLNNVNYSSTSNNRSNASASTKKSRKRKSYFGKFNNKRVKNPFPWHPWATSDRPYNPAPPNNSIVVHQLQINQFNVPDHQHPLPVQAIMQSNNPINPWLQNYHLHHLNTGSVQSRDYRQPSLEKSAHNSAVTVSGDHRHLSLGISNQTSAEAVTRDHGQSVLERSAQTIAETVSGDNGQPSLKKSTQTSAATVTRS